MVIFRPAGNVPMLNGTVSANNAAGRAATVGAFVAAGALAGSFGASVAASTVCAGSLAASASLATTDSALGASATAGRNAVGGVHAPPGGAAIVPVPLWITRAALAGVLPLLIQVVATLVLKPCKYSVAPGAEARPRNALNWPPPPPVPSSVTTLLATLAQIV